MRRWHRVGVKRFPPRGEAQAPLRNRSGCALRSPVPSPGGDGGDQSVQIVDLVVAEPGALFGVTVDLDHRETRPIRASSLAVPSVRSNCDCIMVPPGPVDLHKLGCVTLVVKKRPPTDPVLIMPCPIGRTDVADLHHFSIGPPRTPAVTQTGLGTSISPGARLWRKFMNGSTRDDQRSGDRPATAAAARRHAASTDPTRRCSGRPCVTFVACCRG